MIAIQNTTIITMPKITQALTPSLQHHIFYPLFDVDKLIFKPYNYHHLSNLY